MPRPSTRPLVPTVVGVAGVLALLPAEALALARLLTDLGDIDSHQRLWLAAFGGLSLGVAFGLFSFELRSRALSVAIRRLFDLVVGMDGRANEHARASASVELRRLSDELMFVAQRAARERRESERRMDSWEALFAAALDGMFALDAGGHIRYINPAAERLFKVKADETIGRRLVDVMLPPSHRSPDNAAFANDLATGKAQGRTQELVAQRSDGRQFPVEVSIAEFGEGEHGGFVAIARDISQVRRGRAELKRVQRQAASTEATLRAEIAALKRDVRPAPVPRPAERFPSARGTAAPGAPAANSSALGRAATPRAVPFTLEQACGDAMRKLAARAERRGLGFRYEDNELATAALLGDPAPLRRVLIGLTDSVARVSEAGELVVHLQASAGAERTVTLAAQITSTCMTDAQAARLLKPFAAETTQAVAGAGPSFMFLGTRVFHHVAPGTGAVFRFELPFEADLSQVALDLSALPAPSAPQPPAPRVANAAATRLHQDFMRSAARLRSHAETRQLTALWDEAHRLKDAWQRYGGRDDIGLVTALAHTARGGDATNAVMLARRLADALEDAARVRRAAQEPRDAHDAHAARA